MKKYFITVGVKYDAHKTLVVKARDADTAKAEARKAVFRQVHSPMWSREVGWEFFVPTADSIHVVASESAEEDEPVDISCG